MKKSLVALFLVLAMLISAAAFAESDYEPVTITLNLERTGLGENVDYTITEMPHAAVASGDQMADMFFDLGLEQYMAGFTRGSCWSTTVDFAARETVLQLLEPGANLSSLSKTGLISASPAVRSSAC